MEETSLLMPCISAGAGKGSPGHKLGCLLAVGAQWAGDLGREEGGLRSAHLISHRTANQHGVCGLSCLIPNPTQEVIQDATKKES